MLAPGNVALAHEGDGGCGCETKEITGAEKNKIISNLLKSDELKNARKDLTKKALNGMALEMPKLSIILHGN